MKGCEKSFFADYKRVIVIVLLFSLIWMFSEASALTPNGATVSSDIPVTASNESAGNASAMAGNITELTITGFSTTQTWQGFYGNVTGVIQLADANINVMYNWSLLMPSGEVYASTNSTINWVNIQCFNFTANGSMGSAGETAGQTNLAGYNLTRIHGLFNISGDAADSVNNTFVYLGGANGHDEFYTASKQFGAGECPNTRVYDNTGAGVDGNFEEVLLYEPTTTSIIFASLLEKNGINSFNEEKHNFEMLVLENGHNGDVTAIPYYFYLEIE
jgi:hypothetical protein